MLAQTPSVKRKDAWAQGDVLIDLQWWQPGAANPGSQLLDGAICPKGDWREETYTVSLNVIVPATHPELLPAPAKCLLCSDHYLHSKKLSLKPGPLVRNRWAGSFQQVFKVIVKFLISSWFMATKEAILSLSLKKHSRRAPCPLGSNHPNSLAQPHPVPCCWKSTLCVVLYVVLQGEVKF